MTPERIPYFKHPKVEVSIVVNDPRVTFVPRHASEVLIVRDSWYPDVPAFGTHDERKRLGPFDQVYFLSNTEEIHQLRTKQGFNSHFVNIGCFVDRATFAPVAAPKLYDAVMIARFTRMSLREVWARHYARARVARGPARLRELARMARISSRHRESKRHWLAARVERLALLDPVYGSNSPAYKQHYRSRSNCRWCNDDRIAPADVAQIVARAHCGLALSEIEGVCRASSEYLLCGVPVVTTQSTGGRDVWYDDYNAIVVPPDPEAVRDATTRLASSPRDPVRIRRDYIARANMFKERFARDVLQRIFTRYGVDGDPRSVMNEHPFRWWPESSTTPLADA